MLEQFENSNGFFDFHAFVGTSAGAIAAVLLAAGFTGEQLEQKLRRKSFRDFLDGKVWSAPVTFWFNRGLHPGYSFIDWLREQLHERLPKQSDVRMQDLPRRAVIYASTRDAGEIVFDTNGEHKETAVHTAARCSMSIPYFFQPQWFDNRRVYDGGLLNNYPVQIFLEQERHRTLNGPQPEFLALYLGSSKPRSLKPGLIFADLMSISIDKNDTKLIERYKSQTLLIDTDPIGTIDFDLTDGEKDYLVRQGQVAALNYLGGRGLLDAVELQSLAQMRARLDVLRTEIVGSRQTVRSRTRMRRLLAVAALGCVVAVVGFTLRPMSFNKVLQPCQLRATIEPSSGEIRPLFLTVSTNGKYKSYPVQPSTPIDFSVQPENVSRYDLIIEWSDKTQSNFSAFSGCKPVDRRKSEDERSTLRLAPLN